MNKEKTKEPKQINILGTVYTIWERDISEDSCLMRCDGYCDKTTKEIVVLCLTEENCQLHNPEWYKKKIIRHEIVHAFLFESGLHEHINTKYKTDHDEQMVDWIANQIPKIWNACKEADCL